LPGSSLPGGVGGLEVERLGGGQLATKAALLGVARRWRCLPGAERLGTREY